MPEYTNYAADGTYWTIRKRNEWYLVQRLRSGTNEEVERWGWYERPGAAATAVGLLSYRKGLADSAAAMENAIAVKMGDLGDARIPAPSYGPGDERPDPDEINRQS